ncbi:hypothetical protein TthSNM76_23330 (plasmid) [Thermus thermophilus]|nr:hypothetical protein TthSNM76_23330 [Thermus thermophilus]
MREGEGRRRSRRGFNPLPKRAVQDPMARMAEMVNFTKNAALLGALLMLLTLWR